MLIALQILTVLLLALGVGWLVVGIGLDLQARWIRRRLAPLVSSELPASAPPTGRWRRGLHRASSVIDMLSRLSVPQAGWQNSALHLRFIRAGLRYANAPQIYFALKTGLVLLALLSTFLLMPVLASDSPWSHRLVVMLSSALVANFLPDMYLHLRTKERAQRMQDSLPDIIDLLVICTESGLGMDAAIGRVAREMARSSPELAEEFYIMGLEIRAGAARMAALRNLAERVNLEDLHDLVSMLIQADRFGTSLAVSLRVQSDVMRGKRMQRAEEIAAKIPTKMLLPLVAFIFPVLMMVLLGPAVIQMGKIFGS